MVAWSALQVAFDDDDDAELFELLAANGQHAPEVAAAMMRRRRLASLQFLQQQGSIKRQCGPQGKKTVDTAPFSWAAHMLRLTESDFKRRYRLDPDSFYKFQIITSCSR